MSTADTTLKHFKSVMQSIDSPYHIIRIAYANIFYYHQVIQTDPYWVHFLLETAPPENATALANAIVNIFPNDSMMDVLSYCIQLEVSKTGTSTNSLQHVQN